MRVSGWMVVLVAFSTGLSACGGREESYPTVEESALKGVVRTSADSPNPTAGQLARRSTSNEKVRALGLPVLETLPVVEEESVVVPRDVAEVARRCVAIGICAVKGETQGNDPDLINGLVADFEAGAFFSPAEAAFIADAVSGRQAYVDFAWRYECMHTLLWALGHIAELKPPNEICDVPNDVGVVMDMGATGLINDSVLRSQSEILDMADYYYRLHWAAIELRIKGKQSAQIDEGIIRERHRALNWLIRYQAQAWDEVTTDT